MNYLDKIQNAYQFLRTKTTLTPQTAIVLGSGLGDLAGHVTDAVHISFTEIPHFPAPTVEGHDGQLIFGKLEGQPLLLLKGRVHYYEGYSMREVTFPIRVMQALGIKTLILTNACGGLRADMKTGELILIRDHINLAGDNPLRGENHSSLGPRFPDLSEAYDPELIRIAEKAAAEMNLNISQAVYAMVNGPCYETEAEANFLRIIGADIVGMSTVPECIVANHAGMKVLGISCITDIAPPFSTEKITHEKVMEIALKVQPVFIGLVKSIVKKF